MTRSHPLLGLSFRPCWPPRERLPACHRLTTRTPQRGDKVCRISDTKANPRFTWVLGGQRYEFCCPPCIDEFLTLAKEHPEQSTRD